MNLIAFVLLIAATILFLVAAFRTRPVSLVYLGLAAFSAGVLVEFAAKSHDIQF